MPLQKTNLKINQIFTQDPKNSLEKSIFKKNIYKIAFLISVLAVGLFAFTVVSYIGASSVTAELTQLAFALATPSLSIFLIKFFNLYKNNLQNAKFFKKVIKQTQILSHKKDNEIKSILKKYKFKNLNNPKSLIYPLAKFIVLDEDIKSIDKSIEKDFEKNLKISKNQDPDLQKKLNNPLIKIGINLLEKKVLKSKLMQAHLYYIINNPKSQKNLSDFGKISTLSYNERVMSIFQKEDYYFYFNDAIAKSKKSLGITFSDLVKKDIEDISKIIFEK